MLRRSNKTSWGKLGIVVAISAISIWFVFDAMTKPFVEWDKYNQVRAEEIRAITE